MKHFKQFFVFALLALFSVGAWGEEASFAPTDFSGQGTSGSGSAISATVDGVTFACDKGYGTTQFRCYSGGKITISSSNTITAIAFTFSGSYTGGLETSYTGLSTTSWEKTLTSQARITACTVTYSAGGGSKTLTSIAVSGTPTKTSYYAGDEFDPAGLTVTGTYSDATSGPIVSGITWAYNPSQTLVQSQTSIGVTATVNEITSAEFNVTGLSVAAAPVIVSAIEDIEDGASYYIRGVRSSGSVVEYLTFTDGTEGATISGTSASSMDQAIAITFNKVSDGVYQLVTPEGLYVQPGASNGKISLSESATTCTLSNTTKSWDNSATIAISTVDGSSNTWIIQKNTSGTNFGGYKNSQYDVTLVLASAAATVAKPTISGETPFLSSTTVTLSHADADHIYYTTNGDAPTTSSTEYSDPFELTNTATVKAIAVKGSDVSSVAEKTFTKATIMTVAEARTAIDNGGDLSNKYVAGIISQIDEYNSTYHSITYWISDDGTTTDQLQVYSGLAGIALGGANFTAKEDLLVGDDVTVNGTLKKYNSIYEFDKNNSIVICKLKARLAWGAASFDADLNASNTFPVLTNASGVTVAYSSTNTDAATIDPSTGEITLVAVGTTNIKATFVGDENYKANEVSYTLNVANSMVHATISFNVDGGEAIADMTDQHELPNPLPVATKAGKNFGGWFTDVDKTIAAVAGDAITSDVVLYAKWLDPYTVAEAKAVIDATPAGTENQYVAGIISQVDSYNKTYKSITYWISADGTTTDQLEVYSGKGLSSADFSAKEDLQVGDEVVVAGTLKKFSDIYEFDKNNYLYSFNRPAVPTYSITYVENGANEDITDVVEATKLPDPLPTVTKDGKAFGGWYTTSTFDPGTEAVAGAALTDDVILYAKWVDVSIWALTYGSNVTVGTDKVVINAVEYAAKKTGTNSAFGSTTIEVPTGTTTLHFHAAGWGADAVVNLEVKKGETLLNTFALTKDAGVKSNSPFTLEGTPYLQYYSVALSEITEPTTITFEAKNDGGKRFVLYGVNQEGGTVPATITANPMSVSFGSVEQNASVTAKTINVTLQNVAAATVTLAGDDAFSIDHTSLTENGTITVTPNTTTVGTYAATVTISDDANAADAVVVNVSMTVTEPEVNDDVTGTWTLVTDAATLAAGKKVIIASIADAGVVNTMAEQKSNNRGAKASTVVGTALTPTLGTKVFTLVDAGEGKLAFKGTNNKYLCAASSGSNHLKEQDTNDAEGQWIISIDGDAVATVTAQGDYTRNVMRFNPNSGNPLFACYASTSTTGTLVTLYMLEETTPPAPEVIRGGLSAGKWGTICPKQTVENVEGASFYQITYLEEQGGLPFNVVFDEIGGKTLTAGQPYFFIAEGEEIKGIKTGAELDAADPAGVNGFYGYIGASPLALPNINAEYTAGADNTFVIYNNSVFRINSATNLKSERCYININATEPTRTPSSASPVRRRVVMGVQNTNTATGMDELNASEAPRKMIIDGKMYIFRGEKMYNANGILVK